MPNPRDIQRIGELGLSDSNPIGLARGDDSENTPWRSLINTRLKVEGEYAFWKTRGGTTSINSFFGNILTIYPFQATVGNTTKEYLAVHTAGAKVYLWDVNANTSDEIISSGVSTSKQVQFANIGRFLFVFDYDAGTSQYYDLAELSLFDFLSYKKSYITAINYLAEGVHNNDIWNFEVGEDIIVFPNAVWDSGQEIITSADGDGQLNPDDYSVRSFLYTYNGGKYLVDSTGTEYKETQYLTFSEDDGPLDYTVGGSGDDFTIDMYYIPLNEAGEPAFESYRTEIISVSEGGYVSFEDPVGVRGSAQIGGVTDDDIDDENIIFPYSPDLESLVGKGANKELSADGTAINSNSDYQAPRIYRQYVVIDMLNDGSITLPGKPYEVQGTPSEIHQTGATEVKFTISAPDSNVAKRFLCATRWQPNKERAFDPSNENYDNSPLFIVREINPEDQFVVDKTHDERLLRQVSEILPTVSGVADLFGGGQIKPISVAQFKGSLMMGGYEMNRPVPTPYINPSNATTENIFVNFQQTTQLPNDMAVAFQFEYTDGKRSQIVETEEFLQEGGTTETTTVSCEQTKASASHTVQSGASEDGDLTVTYDGVTITITLSASTHSTDSDVAEAIRQAIEDNSDIDISATVPSGSDLDYLEKRFGEALNGNVINFEPVLVAAIGEINTQANNLFQAASEGYLDVTANNLGSGSSENHQITIGANTTNSITINDTDTLQDIVDKYVTEINNDSNISPNWTASKVDNGDGTWRCLVTADTQDESFNGTTVSVDNVDVDVTTQDAQGGNDGEESHTITVGANTTASITVLHSDTLQEIAQKYVDAINNDGTISSSWTASLVDNGDGTWKCEIKSDTKGSADNGTTVSLTKSDTVSAGSEVDTTASDASGGSDGPGVTFDTEDPQMSGAQEPVGETSKGFVAITQNNLQEGGQSGNIHFTIDGNTVVGSEVFGSDSLADIAAKLQNDINGDATISSDWTAISEVFTIDGVDYPGVSVRSDDTQGESWNGSSFESYIDRNGSLVTSSKCSAPGREWKLDSSSTAGGDDGCLQAKGSITVDANNLGSGASEDHTLSIDGNTTDPITINDTDSLEQIIDKYIAEIRATHVIDRDWRAEKFENTLAGVWYVQLYFRSYGSGGNNRVIDVTGDTDVSVSAVDSSGGEDAGTVESGAVTEVNANRVQIHSLNLLVSKIFIIGRTTDGSGNKSFHPIDQFDISDAQAHGMVIGLPNTQAELDDIETETHPTPSSTEVLETTTFHSNIIVGTPFQQFHISDQESIDDRSNIQRVVAVAYDSDKSVMRYQVAIFTDKNIQQGFYVEKPTNYGPIFESDVEISNAGLVATNREGISKVNDVIFFESRDGLHTWVNGNSQKILNTNRYDVLANNEVVDVSHNENEGEYWFVCRNNTVVVYDPESQTFMRMLYEGSSVGTLRASAFYGGNLYIGLDSDLCITDQLTVYDDLGQGSSESLWVTGKAISQHIGNELAQVKLIELAVMGQGYTCNVELDLQPERREDVTTDWSKSFNGDYVGGEKTLKMHGTPWEINRRAIMPKMRLSFYNNGDGHISKLRMKQVITGNQGKARQ